METKKEEEIVNGGSEKNMYEKVTNLIKSMLPKQEESLPDKEKKNEDKLQKYKNQINEYKRLLKENESLNLLKSNGLDESLKDLITHHPNPKEAIQTLKSFKDEHLKKSQEIQPLNINSQNKSKLHYFE